MTKTRLCQSCRWWAPDGTCRALPPSPCLTPYRGKVTPRRAVWPLVLPTDWCGRWKRRRKPAKESPLKW